jgi:hypothetical protein
VTKKRDSVTLTAYVGSNRYIFPKIMALYVQPGAIVADVTFGNGSFWKDIDCSLYRLRATDLVQGVDFRSLPYANSEIDCLVLDPPYMHGGATIKHSINKCYRNQNSSHESVVRLYAAGLVEAARVLKPGGIVIVKSQDEIEGGKQRLSHCEIIHLLELIGFVVINLFVLVQQSTPALRHPYQRSARKNHSYVIVARFKR